jgi:hypothetical protein
MAACKLTKKKSKFGPQNLRFPEPETLRGLSLFDEKVRNYTRDFTPGGMFMGDLFMVISWVHSPTYN